ncbi:MAG: DNA repair protein RadC [Phototrophicaceae bacterium]
MNIGLIMVNSNKNNLTMHDIPDEERPRERLMNQGANSLSTTELLAIILRTGSQSENVLQLASRILSTYGGLRGLARVTADELLTFKGLGTAKAAQILASMALGQRANMLQPEDRPQINSAKDAAQLLSDMGHLNQEQVRVMLLDSSRKMTHIQTVYIGTVNMSVLRISELYREAIIRNSPAMIVAHNHPSGDTTPSPEDIDMTRALVTAGELLDIQLVDHLIIGQSGWHSLRELGLGF